MNKIVPVILCGGVGSRLWPVSRQERPKPFIRLADGQSLLQKAWLRAASLPQVGEIVTVSNKELFFQIKDEYSEVYPLSRKKIIDHYLLEPFGKNTAPATTLAALEIAKRYGEDAILLVLAADHLISRPKAFEKAASQAAQLALKGRLVVFGIKPDSPETGYGYIEAAGNSVKRFIEKPPLKDAEKYFSSGKFLWNSGMFCFTAKTLLGEIKKYRPDIYSLCLKTFKALPQKQNPHSPALEINPKLFALVPEQSLDYAVMEKSKNAAVIASDIGWSDIGSWNAMASLIKADKNGNRVKGEAILLDAKNCHIQADGRVVAAVGIKDLIVIDTLDALLVAAQNRAQDVKEVYSQLKSQGSEIHRVHRTVYRPWGSYTVLEEGPDFKIKRIEVLPQRRLSLQLHHKRSEHWVVLRGQARIQRGEQKTTLKANESTFIPAHTKHRLENPGKSPLILIEVQSGSYLGEDDIIRFEDQYGRR